MDAGVSGAGGAGGGGGLEGEKKKKPPEGEGKVKRKMKTALQLETLEKTYAVETYPSETLRADLSVQLGLSDRQLQMWFCHRRLKDRKTPPVKRPKKDASPSAAMGSSGGVGDEMVAGEGGNGHVSGSGSGSSPFGHGELQQKVVVHRAAATGSAVARIGADMPAMKRYYEPPQAISELRAIAFVEAQLGESLRDDGPILGMEFDPLPPGAFGAPIVTTGQQKPAGRLYEAKLYERPDAKLTKVSSRALHEYQFLPEQPSVRNDSYDRGTSSHHYSSPSDIPSTRTPASTSRSFGQANEQAPSSYGFVAHVPNLSVLPHQGRQANVLPSTSGDYNIVPSCKNPHANITVDPQSGASHPIAGVDNSITPPDRRATHDEEILRLERKRKSEEARIAREVEAHEKRIRKELEKQDILRRKREEQIRKEMERQDRERRKEEERLLREKQREEERFQREQRREMERREKFLQKETIRAEKLRIKEEMRREKEAARLKAANERATARRIAKESTELIDDERVELMDLAAARLGLPSVLAIDNETMQNLDSFRDMLTEFPPESVHMKMPFTIQPWIHSEENTGNLLMVWRFLITFADILGLWPFTLDEFVQSFHDYDSRLLGEIHLALLRSIIKDIEDVARTPSSTVLGANQHSAANPGGGHPHIVEGAYAWGFDIRSWQHHLNPLTWPEILRQFALSAGFGPKLKKRSVEPSYLRDENEGNDGVDVISTLRNGVAAENALAIMQERGYSNPRRSRHRLTPGTVKFAAFHVLSLEGSQGLTILEVADKIQKSGLRDLTTSKTPEASIAAALSRDTKLFERTAPSTYCVRTPYRKDPIDAETILSEAREKIQVFKNGYFEGEDADDVERYVERDEDSESDVAEDLEADLPSKPEKENLVGTVEQNGPNISVDEKISVGSVDKSINVVEIQKEESLFEEEDGSVIDESNCGELWVQALTEGEYSDLSVDERLNALVALIGVANEGNSIRIVLEERLEAANALKKQMWAEAQVDKRRMKEEYSTKMQYASSVKPEQSLSISALDGRKSPSLAVDDKSYLAPQEPFGDQQNDMNHPNYISAGPDNIPLQQGGYAAEKTRSQFKSLIGHKAEEMYVYRSLPLGQDRRRNRYWQFITSLSRNDPGSGRIFIELRNGHWRLIDSEESFDALLASLDVRGVRESNLLLMLQRIEPSFKETVRKNSLLTRSIKAETTSNPNFNSPRIIDSPNSTLESSSSFSISLGRNETEKKELSKRYQDFEKWMWDECFSASILGALKYGQMRCKQLLGVCEFCHDLYLFEQNHCPLCHKTFDSYGSSFDFDEHVALCKQKEVDLISCNVGSPDPLRIRLLKAQLALIEVSVLAEALEVTWSENYRETWGLKLHNATSAEGLLQILTLLETALKRDFLSLNFETTTELLSSSKPNGNSRSSISVLPWLPQTTSSVALRLMELDSSIFYTHYQKEESQRDKGSLDIAAIPTNFTAVKNVPNYELAEAPHEPPGYPSQDPWDYPGIEPTSSGRGRGRGRGSRGRTTRGGRPQKRVIGSTSDLGPRNTTTNKENFGQLVGWKGRARGRGGRKRGRRTARSRQKKRVTEISDERETSKVTDFDATPVSTEWNMEESTPVGAENVSSSDRSEYDDDEAGPPIGDEYDDLIPASSGYPGVYDNKPEYLMDGVNYGDEDEDDDDDDVDGEDFDEDEQMNVEEYFNGDSDEEEMRRDISSGAQIGNPDDITDSSSSSEYSD